MPTFVKGAGKTFSGGKYWLLIIQLSYLLKKVSQLLLSTITHIRLRRLRKKTKHYLEFSPNLKTYLFIMLILGLVKLQEPH